MMDKFQTYYDAIEAQFLASLKIPKLSIGDDYNYSQARADAAAYRHHVASVGAMIAREVSGVLMIEAFLPEWITHNRTRLANLLWLAGECVSRSLDNLARHHRLSRR